MDKEKLIELSKDHTVVGVGRDNDVKIFIVNTFISYSDHGGGVSLDLLNDDLTYRSDAHGSDQNDIIEIYVVNDDVDSLNANLRFWLEGKHIIDSSISRNVWQRNPKFEYQGNEYTVDELCNIRHDLNDKLNTLDRIIDENSH